MYIKYKLQKKQVSHDGGVTWVDVVPIEQRVGESAGTYSTLEECEGDYSKEYLTIESLEDNNTIYWKNSSGVLLSTISVSTDDGNTWTAYTSTTGGTTIATLNAGDKVLIKGENGAYGTMYDNFNYFGATCQFKIYGNIMSLLYGDSFVDKTLLQASYTFQRLFHNTNVVDASNLILPATTLKTDCYYGMFADCTNLTTAPELPATALYAWCYQQMFSGCTSLTAAPELPATALAERCYDGMFYGCTSLIVAPELPATTLENYCYMSMFEGCTSLTTAPELPATTLANYCYAAMFNSCSSLTTAPQLPATTLASRCYREMFAYCTNLTTAPVLSATSLANDCYSNMFNNCTSLTVAPELPSTTLAYGCYGYMFYNCTSLTTAPQLSATTLVDGCYQYMFAGCSNLNYVKCLATDISATQSTVYWLNGVASTGTFVKASSMNDWGTGTNGIPNNWTVQNA